MKNFASLAEEEMRAKNFLETFKKVKQHNSNPNADFQLETNFFAPLVSITTFYPKIISDASKSYFLNVIL